MGDWKISVKKGIELFVLGGIGAILPWLAQLQLDHPQYAATILIIAGILKIVYDIYKHRDD